MLDTSRDNKAQISHPHTTPFYTASPIGLFLKSSQRFVSSLFSVTPKVVAISHQVYTLCLISEEDILSIRPCPQMSRNILSLLQGCEENICALWSHLGKVPEDILWNNKYQFTALNTQSVASNSSTPIMSCLLLTLSSFPYYFYFYLL